MGRKDRPIVMIAVFMALIVLILFFAGGYATTLGLSVTISEDLIAVFPGLFIFIIGIASISQTMGNPLVVGGFGTIGIGLAFLIQEMYDAAIISDVMLAGATIAQLEILVIIVSIMMGGVAYASSK